MKILNSLLANAEMDGVLWKSWWTSLVDGANTSTGSNLFQLWQDAALVLLKKQEEQQQLALLPTQLSELSPPSSFVRLINPEEDVNHNNAKVQSFSQP